jgi:ABC-2 type transport system permease protein
MSSVGNIYKYLGIEGKTSFSNLANYTSIETFGFTWPILASIFAIGLAGATIAGEIEKGTLGMLLSLPIPRWKIFLSKYLSGLLSILLLVIFSVLPIILAALLLNINFHTTGFIYIAILCLLFSFAIFSLGLMFSALMNEKSHLYGVMGTIVLLMYIANTIAGLKPSLNNLKYISFFHFFNSQKALVNNHISLISWATFTGISIVSLLIGLIVISKRDIVI